MRMAQNKREIEKANRKENRTKQNKVKVKSCTNWLATLLIDYGEATQLLLQLSQMILPPNVLLKLFYLPLKTVVLLVHLLVIA